MRLVPDITSVQAIRPDAISVFVSCDQDGTRTAYAVVSKTKYELGAARPIEANECRVLLLSEQAFQLSPANTAGDIVWLNNQYQLLVSVNGSPAISVQDDQLKALRKKMRTRDNKTRIIREERDKPRQEQERQHRLGSIKQEAALEVDRLAKAERLKRDQQELERQEILRQQAEKEQEKHRREQEKKRKEQEFFTKITSRQVRLNHDAAMLAKYSELIHHTKQLQLEQTLQALFVHPELQHTLLLEIELDQAIEHEKQNLSTLREEAELLESLAKEQERQAEARQRQIAIDRQEAIDTQAADWNNNLLIIAYPNAALELSVIQKHKDTGASIKIIKARAEHLKKRSIISQDSIRPSNDDSIKAGAVIGGVLGLFGGPAGAIFGAAVGGVIGGMSSGSESQEQIAEKAKWRLFISEIDEFINNC